jgi:hypothetical protein
MKKLFMLILLSLSLVACGKKFPYTSKSEKIKLLKEYQETYNKSDESADEKDIDKVFEKAQKILEIVKELEKRSWDGDEKASKEIEEWNKLVIEMNIEF